MAHVVERVSKDFGFFAVEEESGEFGFGGGGYDMADDASGIEDGTVVDGGSAVSGIEVEVARGTTAGAWFVEV